MLLASSYKCVVPPLSSPAHTAVSPPHYLLLSFRGTDNRYFSQSLYCCGPHTSSYNTALSSNVTGRSRRYVRMATRKAHPRFRTPPLCPACPPPVSPSSHRPHCSRHETVSVHHCCQISSWLLLKSFNKNYKIQTNSALHINVIFWWISKRNILSFII